MKLRRFLPGLALLCGAIVQPVMAADSFNPLSDPVPPNILFLVDLSASMDTCWNEKRTDTNGDGSITDLDTCVPLITSPLSVWRIATVQKAITDVVNGVDKANFALAFTDPIVTHKTDPDGIGNIAARQGIVVPFGSNKATLLAKLAELATSATSTGTILANPGNNVPLAEALDDVRDYFELGSQAGSVSPSSPINYYCQTNHVIIITDGVTPAFNAVTNATPDTDSTISSTYANYAASSDFNPASISTLGYYNKRLDNVASYLANSDLSLLVNKPNAQHVYTHVLAIDNGNTLFQNTAANGGGSYSVVTKPASLEGELWGMVNSALKGSYVAAPPTVSANGDKLFMGYFDINSSYSFSTSYEEKTAQPLYYGHLLAYNLVTDATKSTFGQIDNTVTEPQWDAGVILASRWVGQQDYMSQDNNGEGVRDIYTNIDNDATLDPFDGSMIDTLCPYMLDTSVDAGGDYPGVGQGHDVDGDGDVDRDDCKHLMDFVRGYYLEDFISTGQARGHWKLGDIRHSQVVVAEREPKIYTRNPTLREFLANDLAQTIQGCPYASSTKCALDVAFVTANDGMIHAFSKPTGDELWAYIPSSLLGEVAGAEEIGQLVNLMHGETVMMDATPRIDYIWLDGYQGKGLYKTSEKDGAQKENEWVRVLMVGMGAGGRYYLGMDITDPQHPYLLWEDTNDTSPLTGVGYTTSTPVAGLVYDTKNTPGYDRWVAFYGSGQPDGSNKLESRLYIKSMTDLTSTAPASEAYADTGIKVTVDLDKDGLDDGTGFPSNPTAVDRDNDGDIDEVFLVNSAGVMYKFIINTTNINSSAGCLFFDPQSANTSDGKTAQYIGKRTDSYWSAAASFSSDGSLLLFWGTGSPYSSFSTDYGYFYSVIDSSNASCKAGALNTDCNGTGFLKLDSGEKLTGSPLVYAKTVYFSTFVPSSDRCSTGEGRLYGVNYETCKAAMDTNGDGSITSSDTQYVTVGNGTPSGIVVANDSIYVATSDGTTSGDATKSVHRVTIDNDPFAGTVAIQWRELF